MSSRETRVRQSWAAEMMARCSDPAPSYGSAAFNALAYNDPRRVCATVRAAECWARAGDELVESLRVEVDLAARAHKRAEDSDYQARQKAHREQWSGLRLVKGVAYADTDDFRDGPGGRPA